MKPLRSIKMEHDYQLETLKTFVKIGLRENRIIETLSFLNGLRYALNLRAIEFKELNKVDQVEALTI